MKENIKQKWGTKRSTYVDMHCKRGKIQTWKQQKADCHVPVFLGSDEATESPWWRHDVTCRHCGGIKGQLHLTNGEWQRRTGQKLVQFAPFVRFNPSAWNRITMPRLLLLCSRPIRPSVPIGWSVDLHVRWIIEILPVAIESSHSVKIHEHKKSVKVSWHYPWM